jgi:hypothetical protein
MTVRGRMTSGGTGLGFALALMLGACAGPYGKMNEVVSPNAPGDSFRTIVVIAGDDDQNTLQITAKVRQQLNDRGVVATRRSGLWTNEREALVDICPLGEGRAADGLLFVLWNEFSLYDCRTHKQAYLVRGAMRGTDAMLQRLTAYLRVPSK